MKTTALTSIHEALGAKMTEFAGYNMPVRYGSITEEHQCVRKKVGMFDVSHMGEFLVKGPDALDLLQKISSNDVAQLYVGKVQYSCLMNAQGGIVDDMLVYRLNETDYLMVVNASNIDKDWKWINENNNLDTQLENISDQTALLAIQGPLATEALQSLTEIDLGKMKYYTFQKGRFAGVEEVIVSATGYTGSGGFELYLPNKHAATVWNAIMEKGEPLGLQPIGLGARNTLRLEMGFRLYGNDINDTTTPLEAGLGWITKLKAKDFVGKDQLLQQKQLGLQRRLVGFELLDKGIARHGYPVVDNNGVEIGQVTSGTKGPTANKSIGLAYVPNAYRKTGSDLFIQVRKKVLRAKVVKVPFI